MQSNGEFGATLASYAVNSDYIQRSLYLSVAIRLWALPLWWIGGKSAVAGDPWWFPLMMAAAGAGLVVIGEVVRRQRQSVLGLLVTLYERGMEVERAREPFSVAWTDVQSLMLGRWYVPHRAWEGLDVRITERGGTERRLRLENFQVAGLVHLAEAIATSVGVAQLPAALARFERHEWLRFGPLEVSCSGVRCGSKTAGWDELDVVEARRGALVLKRNPGWRTWKVIPLRRIPNTTTLLALIRPRLTAPLRSKDLMVPLAVPD